MSDAGDNYLAADLILRLAREIAMNHWTIDQVLDRFNLTEEQWDQIRINPRFLSLVEQEAIAWNSANNTHERVKLKSGAMLEEWLIEANKRLYDRDEPLPAKVALATTIGKFAGIGTASREGESTGEKFTVTINLGAAEQIKIEKDATPKVIEGKVSG